MIARAGAWCSVNFDRFSLKSKTMAMEMIRALVYLQLHILGTGILLLVLVQRFEVLPDDGSVGNDVGRESEGER